MADVALIEKPGVDGVTQAEVANLYSKLDSSEAYLVEFDAHVVESAAFGLITPACAEALGYETGPDSPIAIFVADIMDDMDNETDDGLYDFCGFTISLER